MLPLFPVLDEEDADVEGSIADVVRIEGDRLGPFPQLQRLACGRFEMVRASHEEVIAAISSIDRKMNAMAFRVCQPLLDIVCQPCLGIAHRTHNGCYLHLERVQHQGESVAGLLGGGVDMRVG